MWAPPAVREPTRIARPALASPKDIASAAENERPLMRIASGRSGP
jgi:hypothetical protein